MKDPIVQAGDPVLRRVAKPVAPKDATSAKIKKIISRMKAALSGEEYGVAIAAPQIGESLRIFVVAGKAFSDSQDDDGAKPTEPDRVFINPTLSRLSKKTAEMSEGCLSVRGKYGTVLRHEKASVAALGEDGKPFTYHGTGLVAHIFQHECDHLDGILYIDKAVKLEEDEDLKGARQKLKEKHGV